MVVTNFLVGHVPDSGQDGGSGSVLSRLSLQTGGLRQFVIRPLLLLLLLLARLVDELSDEFPILRSARKTT